MRNALDIFRPLTRPIALSLFPSGHFQQWRTIISPTLLNGGFESAGAGGTDVFANWFEAVTGASTISDDTVTPYSGGHACKMNIDASNSVVTLTQVVCVVGRSYRLTFWAKCASGTASVKESGVGQYGLQTLSTTWTQYTIYFTADSSTLGFSRNGATSNSIVLDDVTLEVLG